MHCDLWYMPLSSISPSRNAAVYEAAFERPRNMYFASQIVSCPSRALACPSVLISSQSAGLFCGTCAADCCPNSATLAAALARIDSRFCRRM
ncbi:hypothetical protein B0H17DRAFT_341928 [Mycena rosella]|uniref:Uncharacterized protein n=1 Tax=Mycena rosella TaxID=1033263 RepID=A0AAD7GJV4_MYCRO|nr:hypothetical protein B0H17DRAFT_341928 [Mycena rosella]